MREQWGYKYRPMGLQGDEHQGGKLRTEWLPWLVWACRVFVWLSMNGCPKTDWQMKKQTSKRMKMATFDSQTDPTFYFVFGDSK